MAVRQGAWRRRAGGRGADFRSGSPTTIAFGDHGSTYGGNLLACRAALVFLDELDVGSDGARGGRSVRRSKARSGEWPRGTPCVVDVRGAGVIWGLELDRPAAPVVEAALERGLLINRTADTVLRLLPPYIVDAADVDQMAVVLDAALSAAVGEKSSMSVILRAAAAVRMRRRFTALVAANLEVGHLLPRSIDDVREHIARFFVAELDGQVVGCAELARLSTSVAEVRSLVVDESLRGQKIGTAAGGAPRGERRRGRLLDAVRVHARPGALRAARVHHRPAHLDAREDRARLQRAVRCSAAAASTRSG